MTVAGIMNKKNVSSVVLLIVFAATSISTAFVIHHNSIKKSNADTKFKTKLSPLRRIMGKMRMMKSLPSNVVKYS